MSGKKKPSYASAVRKEPTAKPKPAASEGSGAAVPARHAKRRAGSASDANWRPAASQNVPAKQAKPEGVGIPRSPLSASSSLNAFAAPFQPTGAMSIRTVLE